MKKNEFAILHELKGTQFLVDTDYDHEEKQYKLSLKFWASNINGYATMTLSWADDKEKDFKRMFDKFKNPNECQQWVGKINK